MLYIRYMKYTAWQIQQASIILSDEDISVYINNVGCKYNVFLKTILFSLDVT